MELKPTLYGLENSNRKGKDLWGKNQFNSTFPLSLACYMWDNKINPVYIKVTKNFSFEHTVDLDFLNIFQVNRDDIFFEFEGKYTPYTSMLYDEIDRIDLIVKNQKNIAIRPFEVKLTVLPDSTTCKELSMDKWGCELVIRPVSSSYALLSIAEKTMFNSLAREIIEPIASKISQWDNEVEIFNKAPQILESLESYIGMFYDKQQPFLIQPVWKTKGQSIELADDCFDIFVWSDAMLCKLIVDSARRSLKNKKNEVSRSLRECARMLRCLYELHTRNKVNITQIYRSMGFKNQTDKSVAFSGKDTCKYMSCDRLTTPILNKNTIKHLILNNGEEELKPERRFDATIYFTFKSIKN